MTATAAYKWRATATALITIAVTVSTTLATGQAQGGVTAGPKPSPSAAPTSQPPGDVLSQVHTAGRVKVNGNAVQYSWPGVYFEGRVQGTGVGIVLNDSAGDYDVQVDGATVATFVTPGQTTRWVNSLSNTDHTVRVVKRSEKLVEHQ